MNIAEAYHVGSKQEKQDNFRTKAHWFELHAMKVSSMEGKAVLY